MEPYDALIPIEGAGFEIESLRREPVSDDESFNGQLWSVAAAAGVFDGGETSCECFGFGAVGAGSMPRPSLLPTDRINSLVDDCVPDLTFACHVALHHRLLPNSERNTNATQKRSYWDELAGVTNVSLRYRAPASESPRIRVLSA